MNYKVLSLVSIVMLALPFAATPTFAETFELYEDAKTKQVFTEPGPGRQKLSISRPATEAGSKTKRPESSAPSLGGSRPSEAERNAQDHAAKELEYITTERKKSPEFLMGKETGPNMTIASQDNPDLRFSLGIRFMGTAEYTETDSNDGGGFSDGSWDFYGRRVRFEPGASLTKDIQFVMDIRNDRANQGDRGEGSFNVGDAKLTVKKIANLSWLNAAFYRAKVDVSRSETIKSGFLVEYDRPEVADSAANWVSQNRRAANIQFFGDFDKKVHYQLAVGDGIDGKSFFDSRGKKAFGISQQKAPMMGGKILFSPFPGWEETEKTETYFGEGKHFSAGVGQFFLHGIELEPTEDAAVREIDRELTNVEASMHYYNLLLQAEWFNFKGAVQDISASDLNVGGADGWYALAEYVIPDWGYLAPFGRYDYWDTFRSVDDSEKESVSGGINWYLKGNTTKVGVVYQRTSIGEAIGDEDINSFRVVSQFFF